MNEDFKVKVGEFEGPLDLLLDLVEKRKLHINDITLSKVADEFIEFIKSFEKFPISDSADFILIASTLLLIKSKSLLPNLDLTPEEEGSIENLEKRLNDYKKYKELSLEIGKIFGNFLYFAEDKPLRLTEVVFSPTPDISILSLKNALNEVLKNLPSQAMILPKVVMNKVISLEEMIERLSQKIERNLKTSFKDFADISKAEKVEIIVSFLAMLELVKQGLLRVNQEKHFEDIDMESEKTGTPVY